jgi:hypothetical protein
MPYNLFYRDTPVEELYALSFDTITRRGIDYRTKKNSYTKQFEHPAKYPFQQCPSLKQSAINYLLTGT